MDSTHGEQTLDRPVRLFDDRYGVGAFERVLAMLKQPCITFAAIAAQFGVSRERVRQWHSLYLPGAPGGLERRRLCQVQHARKRLLADPIFRAFYRQARRTFRADQIALIRTRDGLRLRSAQILGRHVIVKKARRQAERSGVTRPVHILSATRRAADFVYYQLDDVHFLFVPNQLLPPAGTTYVDSARSKYQPYRNTFAALLGTGAALLAG
jgi:hypothetical protein